MKKDGKMLGVFGGMGPLASAMFMMEIALSTDSKTANDYLETIYRSKPLSPTQAILSSNPQDRQRVLEGMLEVIKNLEKDGADNIAIPCNTAMFWHADMQKQTKVPILNIVEETAKAVHDAKHKRTVILATESTVKTKLYHHALGKYGIECIAPDQDIQAKVTDTIHDIKRDGKSNKQGFQNLLNTVENRHDGHIILGCTELSWFRQSDMPIITRKGITDSSQALAKVAIEKSGYKYVALKKLGTVFPHKANSGEIIKATD